MFGKVGFLFLKTLGAIKCKQREILELKKMQ
jgi:hypothetical protein